MNAWKIVAKGGDGLYILETEPRKGRVVSVTGDDVEFIAGVRSIAAIAKTGYWEEVPPTEAHAILSRIQAVGKKPSLV